MSATIPGASADSISAPSSAAFRRRTAISTSGNSGTKKRVGAVNCFQFIRLTPRGLANIQTKEREVQLLPTIQPSQQSSLSREEIATLSDEVRELAKQRDAVILAHNYQVPEVQDIADYVGDSLALRARRPLRPSVIDFCGVTSWPRRRSSLPTRPL